MEQTRAAVLWAWEVYSTLLLCEIKILAGCQQEEIPLNQQALQFSLNLTFKLYEREILTKQKFKVQIDYLRHNLLYLPWHAVDSISQFSCVRLFVTSWTAALQVSLSSTNPQSLVKLMSIKSVMPSSHLILLSPSPPTFNLSQHQGVFQ